MELTLHDVTHSIYSTYTLINDRTAYSNLWKIEYWLKGGSYSVNINGVLGDSHIT